VNLINRPLQIFILEKAHLALIDVEDEAKWPTFDDKGLGTRDGFYGLGNKAIDLLSCSSFRGPPRRPKKYGIGRS